MSGLVYCQEAKELLGAFGAAARELLRLQEERFAALIGGELDSAHFDDLIHAANERKREAKDAYVNHLETHRCSAFYPTGSPHPPSLLAVSIR